MKNDPRINALSLIFYVGLGTVILVLTIIQQTPEGRRSSGIYTPTPYSNITTYSVNETPFYSPIDNQAFVPIISFKNLTTWRGNSDNLQATIPFLINGEKLYFSGYIENSLKGSSPADTRWRESNVELLCLELSTGKIIWQDWIGDARLATDGQQLYATVTWSARYYEPQSDDFYNAGIIAFNLDTGEKTWETRFDYMSGGVLSFWPLGSEVYVAANNRGYYASYILDKFSGEIKQTHPGEKRFIDDGTVISNGIALKRTGFGKGPVSANRIGIQEPLWAYYQNLVVSNIAVDGDRAYWVTLDGNLVVVDIQTGQVLSTLMFFPGFSSDFDYLNNAPSVAAGNSYVAVYFKDQKQLSVFRFEYPR
jgi:outer membrane protein assembly factor BamB